MPRKPRVCRWRSRHHQVITVLELAERFGLEVYELFEIRKGVEAILRLDEFGATWRMTSQVLGGLEEMQCLNAS